MFALRYVKKVAQTYFRRYLPTSGVFSLNCLKDKGTEKYLILCFQRYSPAEHSLIVCLLRNPPPTSHPFLTQSPTPCVRASSTWWRWQLNTKLEVKRPSAVGGGIWENNDDNNDDLQKYTGKVSQHWQIHGTSPYPSKNHQWYFHSYNLHYLNQTNIRQFRFQYDNASTKRTLIFQNSTECAAP